MASTPTLVSYLVPKSVIGVAWGNGTNAPTKFYAPMFRALNSAGVSVVAATTLNAGSGREIAAAGKSLKDGGCTRIVACGHSQGGGGALRAAAYRPDIFHAVCAIMPGGGNLGRLPCFLITGQYDLLDVKQAAGWLEDEYPGPLLHAQRKNVGHFAVNDTEIIRRVAYFALNDDRWLAVRDHRSWIVMADTA